MRFAILFTLFLLASCSSVSYTHTHDKNFEAKKSDCTFKVQSTLPQDGNYEEIGTINVSPAVINGIPRAPNNPSEFRDKIQSEVCQAGGDVVLGEVNGFGNYIRGTVFRKKN